MKKREKLNVTEIIEMKIICPGNEKKINKTNYDM